MFIMLSFQGDGEEEQEVPFVRKRKQPSTSTSQPREGAPSSQEVREDEAATAKKKKVEEG
jgi:hypothetical protein